MERKEIIRRLEEEKSLFLTRRFDWRALGDAINNVESGIIEGFRSKYILLPGSFVLNYIYRGENGKNYFMTISKNSAGAWPQCIGFGVQAENDEVHLAWEQSPLTHGEIYLIRLPEVECFYGNTRPDMPSRETAWLYGGMDIPDEQIKFISECVESSQVFRRVLVNNQQQR